MSGKSRLFVSGKTIRLRWDFCRSRIWKKCWIPAGAEIWYSPSKILCDAVTQWKAPGTFLEDDMNRYEQPPLAPPQTYELYNLRGFDSLESLLTECNERQKLDAECWMPVYRVCRDTVLLLLPGVCLVCDSFLVLLPRDAL